jgi:hypothetical protein
MEKCPWCGAVQQQPLFEKSNESGAVVQVECESCNRPIKVTLKVVESYVVSLPDNVLMKLTTTGQRVKKNPRWDWCICRTDGRQRTSFKCRCKTGIFKVKEAKKSDTCRSGLLVTVLNENGLLGPIDAGYFLPVEEQLTNESGII